MDARKLVKLLMMAALLGLGSVLLLSCGGDGPAQPPGPTPDPLDGEIEVPAGAIPTDYTVYGGGGAAAVGSDGRFTLPATPQDTTLIVALANGDERRPLISLAGPGSQTAFLSLRTTALSMLVLSPELATDDDSQRARFWQVAEGLSETDALASALQTAYGAAGDPLEDTVVGQAWRAGVEAVLGLLAGAKGVGPEGAPPGGTIHAVVSGQDVVVQDLARSLIDIQVLPAQQPGGPVRLDLTSHAVLSWIAVAEEVDREEYPGGLQMFGPSQWNEALALEDGGWSDRTRVPGLSLSRYIDVLDAVLDAAFEAVWPNPSNDPIELPSNRAGFYVVRFYNGAAHSNDEFERAITSFPGGTGNLALAFGTNVWDCFFAAVRVGSSIAELTGAGGLDAVTRGANAYREQTSDIVSDGEITGEELLRALTVAAVEYGRAVATSQLSASTKTTTNAAIRVFRGGLQSTGQVLSAVANGGRFIEIAGGLLCGLWQPTCIVPLQVVVVSVGAPWDGFAPAPDRIDDLSVQDVTTRSVTLRWTAVSPRDPSSNTASSYDVRTSMRAISEETWHSASRVIGELLPLEAGSEEELEITGLDPGARYYVGIKVADAGGNLSPLSNVVVADTDGWEPLDVWGPSKIEDLEASSVGPTSLTLSWTATGDDLAQGAADHYVLEHRVGRIGQYSVIPNPPYPPKASGLRETFTVRGLSPQTEYHFRLTVFDDAGHRSATDPLVVQTPAADQTPPAAISDLAVTGSTLTTLALAWTASGDDGNSGTADRYEIRLATLAGMGWSSMLEVPQNLRPAASGTVESFNVQNLAPDTSYYFRLKVHDDAGNASSESNEAMGRTTDETPPAAVTDLLFVSATQSEITLSWTATGDNGSSGRAASYDLRYSTNPLSASTWNSATPATGLPVPKPAGQGESATVSALQPRTLYYFGLKVLDEAGNTSGLSNIEDGMTEAPPDTPPAPITDLTADQIGKTSVRLNWTAPGDDGHVGTAAEYDVRYSTSPLEIASWTNATQASGEPFPQAAGSAEHFAVAGLTPHAGYYFAVKTRDHSSNWSAISNIREATTAGDPPVAEFTIDPPAGEVGTTFQFDASASTDPDGQASDLQHRWDWTNDGTYDTPWNPGPEASHQYGAAGTYTVKMEARDLDGLTDTQTHDVTVYTDTTPPAVVTNLAADQVTTTSVRLTWTAPGDDGSIGTATEYDIRYSTSQSALAAWTNATPVSGEPAPRPAGAAEQLTVSGLQAGTRYYFSLKTKDDAGNWSSVASPFAEATTLTLPSPAFTENVTLSASDITLGQPVVITARVRNDGSRANAGGISISFPDLADAADSLLVTSTSSGDAPGHDVYPKNSAIYDDECQPMVAGYLLAEYADTSWTQGETNEYRVTATPKATGTFRVFVRSAMRTTLEPLCQYVNAVPSNGVSDTDQQSWPVKRFDITVNPVQPSGDMVLIPAGIFTMGSPTSELGRWSDETQHQVTLTRSLYVSVHEVTQAEWQAVMGWNESYFPGANRPVETVTWYDCLDYCNRRSLAEGYAPACTLSGVVFSGNHITSATVSWTASANGYRLPTEAEWEYACRAGTVTAFYNGGITNTGCSDPNLDLVGWYCGNSGSQTHDVGQKTANARGLRDTHGNVWEWCWDWYGTYPGAVTDPTGPASGSYRVFRGGSWYVTAQHCRSAYRGSNAPAYRHRYIGLRVARTAP